MPRKRSSRRNSRRRSRRGRSSRFRRTVRRRGVSRIRNLGYLIPDRLRMALPYFDDVDTFPAATSNETSYRGNSIYDPDFSGVGTQPYLFDQMMALYNNYYVFGSKIRVETFMNDLSATAMPRRTVLFPHIANMASFSFGNIEDYAMQPFARMYSETQNNGGKRSVISAYMSSRRMLPTGGDRLAEEAQGTSTTNPLLNWYWNIYTESIDASALVGWRAVKIIYYVEFSVRQIVSPS